MSLGNLVAYPVREIAEFVDELSNSPSELVHDPSCEDDPKRYCLDVTCARETLNWGPRIPAEEDLSRTLRWFVERAKRRTEQRIGSTAG